MAEARAHKGLRLTQTFSSLRHPHYRRLWFTTLVNAGSNWLQQVTLGWLAYDTTDSALVAGLTFGLRALPSLIIDASRVCLQSETCGARHGSL